MISINVFKEIIGRHREDILVILFFIILSALYLGANLFSHQIVAPMDLLLHYPGWHNSGISVPIFDLEHSDILDNTIPQWNFARDSLLHGIVPLWDPYEAGGSPLLPLLTSSILSPGFLVFFIFGGGVGFTLSLLVKLLIAGYGTYKLCRTEMEVLPSLFGGITFMMCGFMATWLMWPTVGTAIWIPWILWGIIRFRKEKSVMTYLLLPVFVALLIFGGFPYIAFCGLALASFLIIWLIVIDSIKGDLVSGLKSGLLIFSSIIAGLGLAAIQILPFWEWLRQFDTSWRHGGSVFTVKDFDILWNPVKYSYTLGSHVIPKVEYCGSVGVLALLFSVIAILYILWFRKRAMSPLSPLFWVPVTLVLLIPVFTIEPLASIFYQLPIFNSSTDSRLLVLLGLSFSLLGAYGLEALMKVTTGLIKKIGGAGKNLVLVAAVLIICLQIAVMAPIGMSQNPVVPSDSYYPVTPTIAYVQNNLLPGQSVLSTSAYMISGTLTYYDTPDWFAHNYHTDQEKEVLGTVVSNAWISPTAAMYKFDQINLSSPNIDDLGIRYVLAVNTTFQNPDARRWHPLSIEDGILILENNNAPPGAYVRTASGVESVDNITVLKYSPNYREYRVNSTQPGIFVTTTRYWPGWVAYRNNIPVPIGPFDRILQSIEIPEGTSDITFIYVPWSFYAGAVISLISLAVLLIVSRKILKYRY